MARYSEVWFEVLKKTRISDLHAVSQSFWFCECYTTDIYTGIEASNAHVTCQMFRDGVFCNPLSSLNSSVMHRLVCLVHTA